MSATSDRGRPSDELGHAKVRHGYDAVAATYQERIGDELAGKPLDRALLAALVEQAGRDTPDAPIADLGCGPGHITGWLADHLAGVAGGRTDSAAEHAAVHAAVRPVGIDLSPAMVELARRAYPAAEFRAGDLLRLPARDGEFGAAVAMYSVIHLTAGELPYAFAEMHRVLRPSGLLLVAFHLGAETVRHFDEWWGHDVDIDFHYFAADTVLDPLRKAGFTVEAWLERTHYPHEAESRRGYALARRGD